MNFNARILPSILFSALFLIVSSCTAAAGRNDVTAQADNQNSNTGNLSDSDRLSAIQKTMTFAAENIDPSEDTPKYESGFAVNGWPGKIIDFPPDSEYDNYLMWLPEDSGVTGVTGATDEIDATIMALADSQKTFHFWGLLTCNEYMDDYHNCRLIVTDLKPGGSEQKSHAGTIDGWVGTITKSSNRNSEKLNFILSGNFPIQFSIDADNTLADMQLDEKDILQKIVRLRGDVYTGNSTDELPSISPVNIEILGQASSTHIPIASKTTDIAREEEADWLLYANDDLQLSFRYPSSAVLTEQGTVTTADDEIVDILSATDYQSADDESLTFIPLCIRLEYRLGYIAITSADDMINQYISCGRQINDTGRLKGIEEDINLLGEPVTVRGFEYIGNSEQLTEHYETFTYKLSDGSLLEYGALEKEGYSFTEYEQTSKESIVQILQTLTLPSSARDSEDP